jgi:signal transduction histidine kinase
MHDPSDPNELARAVCDAVAAALGRDPSDVIAARPAVQALLAPFSANVAAGRVAGSAAHELRNPLAVVATSASILESRTSNDKRASDHVAKIQRQIALATRIVADMVEAGSARPISREPTPLEPLLSQAIEDAALPESMRVEVPTCDGRVLADPRRTRQILSNLLRNSFAAAGGSATVTLLARVESPYIILSVQDDGPGIDPAMSEQLFSLGATFSGAGHGFGLAIARSFARAQGGDLTFVATERGARFDLSLLIAEDER